MSLCDVWRLSVRNRPQADGYKARYGARHSPTSARRGLRQFPNGPKHRLDFLWGIDDAARYARIRYAIGSRGSDDVLSEQTLYYILRLGAFHIEADHAGRKAFIAWCVKLDARHASESLFHLSIQLVYPRGDARRSDVLVKTNRFW